MKLPRFSQYSSTSSRSTTIPGGASKFRSTGWLRYFRTDETPGSPGIFYTQQTTSNLPAGLATDRDISSD